MNYPVVRNPHIPFWGLIPDGLSIGKMVEIRGRVPYGADIFQINFTTKRDEGSITAERTLHISVRFHERVVVRNAYDRNGYGREERGGGFPFASGQPFLMMILVEHNCYRIAVNGQHYWEFAHRLSFTQAKMLYISGTVSIEEIRYMGGRQPGQPVGTCIPAIVDPGFNPWPSSGITTSVGVCLPPPSIVSPGIVSPSSTLQPVINPTIPYNYPIYGGLKPGMMVYISGKPLASAYRLTINLQCGSCPYPPPDIAFHFDARLYNSTIVRNTRVNNSWGREETIVSYFPFRPGVNFDLIIRVESDKYMIALNGQHFLEFRHRIFPLSRVDTLNIENDIAVTSIRFA